MIYTRIPMMLMYMYRVGQNRISAPYMTVYLHRCTWPYIWWPYICTVHDRIFAPYMTVYICTVHDRIFGDSTAKITVYTPYIYGSGQPYICTLPCPLDAKHTYFKSAVFQAFNPYPSLPFAFAAYCHKLKHPNACPTFATTTLTLATSHT